MKKQNFSTLDKDFDPVREKMLFRLQVEEQLQICRWAFIEGNIPVASRAIEMLKGLLWPWFPEGKKSEFRDLQYKALQIEELYNDDDRKDIERYGHTDSTRERTLRNDLKNVNKRRFLEVCGKRLEIILEVSKMLGLGFETEVSAYIDCDKKKPISTEGK